MKSQGHNYLLSDKAVREWQAFHLKAYKNLASDYSPSWARFGAFKVMGEDVVEALSEAQIGDDEGSLDLPDDVKETIQELLENVNSKYSGFAEGWKCGPSHKSNKTANSICCSARRSELSTCASTSGC